ncbi:hypothetical protein [Thermococcus sp.]|uniref:hypothetical protein n=1 Tax=Thermococcus sp. TaxID=35749 RepID=UPI0026280D76|nr:hypothetical protein [Thermococcus sp.]
MVDVRDSGAVREVSIILGATVVYGLIAGMLTGDYNSGVILPSLIIGYAVLFTALLQKFGGGSVKNGLGIGLISILGAALGWFIAAMLGG